MYKDTQQKHCEKGFWLVKQRDNKRQRKKFFLKGRQGESNEKTPRDKKENKWIQEEQEVK